LRKVSGCQVNVFISSYREITEAIENYYGVTLSQFDLDKFKDDVVLRGIPQGQIVGTAADKGREKRRYRRLEKELEVEYFLYPANIMTKAKNISMGGVLFESPSPLLDGTELGVSIHLGEEKRILTSIEVVRSELKHHDVEALPAQEKFIYLIAGAFHFMPNEDQETLAVFLKKHFI
jgi:hypothetical protein